MTPVLFVFVLALGSPSDAPRPEAVRAPEPVVAPIPVNEKMTMKLKKKALRIADRVRREVEGDERRREYVAPSSSIPQFREWRQTWVPIDSRERDAAGR